MAALAAVTQSSSEPLALTGHVSFATSLCLDWELNVHVTGSKRIGDTRLYFWDLQLRTVIAAEMAHLVQQSVAEFTMTVLQLASMMVDSVLRHENYIEYTPPVPRWCGSGTHRTIHVHSFLEDTVFVVLMHNEPCGAGRLLALELSSR